MRLVWVFGWTPPLTAKHIIEKNPAYNFRRVVDRAADELLYPSIPYVLPTTAVADQLQVDPWMAGPTYWTTFVPSDFRFVRGILDEAPCFPCSEHRNMCEAGGLVDEWREVSFHLPECRIRNRSLDCSFMDVEVTLARLGSVYVDQGALLKWLGIYQHACIYGHGEGCNPWLSRLYDRLKCRGLHPHAVLMAQED